MLVVEHISERRIGGVVAMTQVLQDCAFAD